MQLLFGVAVALAFVGIGYYWGRSAARQKPTPKPQNWKQWNFDLSKEKAPSRLAGHSEGAKKTIQHKYTTLEEVSK